MDDDKTRRHVIVAIMSFCVVIILYMLAAMLLRTRTSRPLRRFRGGDRAGDAGRRGRLRRGEHLGPLSTNVMVAGQAERTVSDHLNDATPRNYVVGLSLRLIASGDTGLPRLLVASPLVQPRQIVRPAGRHRQGEDFGDLVGMELADRLLDFVVAVAAGLDPALPFLGGLDFALPAVGAADRPDHLHAGGQPPFDQRPGDPLGVFAVLDGGDDLDVVGHLR